jgi:hypothetical protein
MSANVLFWLLLACWVVAFVAWLLTAPQVNADEPAPVPAHPCAPQGHRYVAQPVTWRCVECGDERTTEGVYDQEHVA